MEYLAQMALSRFGILAGLLSLLGVAIIRVLAHYFTTRIDLMRRDADAQANERAAITQAREREHALLAQEVRAGREKLELLMTNHLEHDRQEREALAVALTEFKAASQAHTAQMREFAEDIKNATLEMARRNG